MTIEKMCFVNPEDFKAVRITCEQCASATVIPLSQFSGIAALLERPCVTCNTPSGLGRNTKELNRLIIFSETLGELAEIMKGRGIKYSLRIECPKNE
jgi:hypothetical protein